MRGKFEMLIAIAALWPLGIHSQGLTDITSKLNDIRCFNAEVTYAITLPQAADDVIYTAKLMSTDNAGDTLAPADYLIEWSVPTPSGVSEGFSAYFDGNHYRFRDQRLQEYHMEWDSIPFIPRRISAHRSESVQKSAQFASLLPQFIAAELTRMSSDPQYRLTVHTDTVMNQQRCSAVEAIMEIQGYVCSETEYVFDHQTGMPLSMEANLNPGALSEQMVTAKYAYSESAPQCPALSEQTLMERYPEVFEKFRQSNFRIENMPGSQLPAFSLPTPTGERYSRQATDSFRCPTIVILLESGSEFSPSLISQIRGAIDSMPIDADVIYAFADNRTDNIDTLLPQLRTGEHALMSARTLARDCGAAALPAVLICKPSGEVANVMVGFNNDMATDVIQMTVLAGQ